MSYTSRGDMGSTTPSGNLRIKTIKDTANAAPSAQSADTQKQEEEIIRKIWDEYGALKQDNAQNPPDHSSASESSPLSAQPDKAAGAHSPPTQATGLTGLLQQYQHNKKRAGGMRSIEVTPQSP